MNQIRKFFAPFIGQVVWQVQRGHGSFLTMEFGQPHLTVREPIVAKPDRSARVRRNLQRRHVVVVGDWHFWIQYGDWKITTAGGILTNDDPAGSPLDDCLHDLDGQKLVSVDEGAIAASRIFGFDLKATLEIWPSEEISVDQWSVYGWGGDIVTCCHNGVLAFAKADCGQRIFKPLIVTWPADAR